MNFVLAFNQRPTDGANCAVVGHQELTREELRKRLLIDIRETDPVIQFVDSAQPGDYMSDRGCIIFCTRARPAE